MTEHTEHSTDEAVPLPTAELSSEILEVEVSIRGATFSGRGGASQVLQAFEAFREFFASTDGLCRKARAMYW